MISIQILIHDSKYFKIVENLLRNAIFENKYQELNVIYIRILNAVDQDRKKQKIKQKVSLYKKICYNFFSFRKI